MKKKLIVLLLTSGLGLLAFSATRVVVCEEAYSEGWGSCAPASGTLDQIVINNPGRIAPIEMHVGSSYPLYCAEARSRWYSYPPPYWYNGGWAYATPWLWYDGNKHGSYDYTNWSSRITSRMSRPSPITQTMWGTYNGATRQGTINIKFRNDSTAVITARLIVCVTEDSCYYTGGSNGDYWHNHVARDYLPDQNGTVRTIASRDSTILTQSFTLASGWRSNYCHVVAFAQSDVLQPDSTKNVYQGGDIKITQLLQVEEEASAGPSAYCVVRPIPNPFTNSTAIRFTLTPNSDYRLIIFDVSGRHIKTISGIASGRSNEAVVWDRTDHTGRRLPSGVYLYRFTSAQASDQGKVIVR